MSSSTTLGVGEGVRKLRRSLPDREAIRDLREGAGQAGRRILNVSARSEAVEKLRESINAHEGLRQQVGQASMGLFEQRKRVAANVIGPVEEYVNGLANTPKEFDRSVRALRVEVDRFDGAVQRFEAEAAKSGKIGSGAGLAGTAAGMGLAAFGPSAAIAVATTFGTASTGAAISTLSGAAAANAALAWLGGGAVAAGGSGMAAGNALLALAGPVGWTMGGLALAGSGAYLHYRNRALAQKAAKERIQVECEIRSLRTSRRKIEGLEENTRTYREGTLASLSWLREHAPRDHEQFDPGQKERLAALINGTRSLGELIREEVT